jgi:hypothetical protein
MAAMLAHRVACRCMFFVFCLTCCAIPSASHFVDPTVAAFPIRPVENAVSHTVRLPAPSSTTCTFTYSTEPQVVNTVKSIRFDMAGWLSAMEGRGECARMTSNYWDYEVCLLTGVKQSKQSDNYGLGKRKVVKAESVLYTDGDKCITTDCQTERKVGNLASTTSAPRANCLPVCRVSSVCRHRAA